MTDEPTRAVVTVAEDVNQAVAGRWTMSDVALMKRTIAPDLNEDEFRLFGRLCMARGLNPFERDVYPIVYNKNDASKRTLVLIQSIDSMRRRGLATGLVADQKGPEFCDTDGVWRDVWLEDFHPAAARYGMRRQGQGEIHWHVRTWAEVAKTGREGDFWTKQPSLMLGIAAERQAWRQTVPGEAGGLYGTEELDSTGLLVDGAAPETLEQLVDERSDAMDVEMETASPPADEPDPSWDATAGPPPDEEYNMQDVFRALWKRMRAATPPWSWEHLTKITGWPEGAAREDGVRALLTGATGSEDELADMVFSALEATRS